MMESRVYSALKRHKCRLTIQQYRTIKGQVRKGDVAGAITGLQRLGFTI